MADERFWPLFEGLAGAGDGALDGAVDDTLVRATTRPTTRATEDGARRDAMDPRRDRGRGDDDDDARSRTGDERLTRETRIAIVGLVGRRHRARRDEREVRGRGRVRRGRGGGRRPVSYTHLTLPTNREV